MASGVEVTITNSAIISALNTPGGAVYRWRDKVMDEIIDECFALSPINKVTNAEHRGGDRVRALIENVADHAAYVEFGRPKTFGKEVFSWDKHKPPGSIAVHGSGTKYRVGEHLLRAVTNSTLAANTNGYTPLL